MKANTIAEHRREKLRKRQADVARSLRTSQGQVSKVEAGHLPAPWERPRWAAEYGVSVARFESLVRAATMRKPNDLPLWDYARGEGSRTDLKTIDGKAVSA